MLLQNTVPTALNVHALSLLHGNRDSETGAVMFWQYMASIAVVPAWLTLYLLFVEGSY